ncbi:MAG: glycosyltransferase [Acidobacteria bacterium]|nr:glycosyltransferase [Acidobacteriota bacterium]
MSIKSVHITNYYHKNSGGISTSFNNLLDAAARHRREVRLVVPGEESAVEQVNEFAKIYYVPAKYSPVFDKRYRVMMPWQYMVKDSPIRQILLAEMPDMIEVTDKYTLSLLGVMIRTNSFKKLGRPMLVHFSAERMDDNVGSFLTSGKLGHWFARRVIGNYTLPNFDFHIANSVYTAEEFYNAYKTETNPHRSGRFFNFCWRFFKAPRIPIEERIFVCPRGVNADIFRADRRSDEVRREMRERAGIPAESTVLLYAGRISPEKNIGLLVEMMKELAADERNDYRLLIAGAGPEEEWLKAQAAKLFPGKIVCLGHLDKETLADYYANADVFVHPNPREPFGIAPLEAMVSGAPTLAPNSGGILSYATEDNAWLVEPSGAKFAATVRSIVAKPEETARRTANAVETALANTRVKSTDNLLATYDRMFEDFQRRKELFTDLEESKRFDYLGLLAR